MVTKIWVSIGSGNGLWPAGTWTNVHISLVNLCGINLRAILQQIQCIQAAVQCNKKYIPIWDWRTGFLLDADEQPMVLLWIHKSRLVTTFCVSNRHWIAVFGLAMPRCMKDRVEGIQEIMNKSKSWKKLEISYFTLISAQLCTGICLHQNQFDHLH